MAPRTWKRPLTLIYDNNYKYGTNLYSGAIGDIEKKYLASMSRTRLPVDRPDVSMSTFAGSSLGTSAQRETTTTTSSTAITQESSYDLRKVKSASDFDLYRSLNHDWTPTLSTIPARSSYLDNYMETTAAAHEAEERRSRRRRRRRADDLDRLELHAIAPSTSYSTYNYGAEREKLDVGFYMDKWRHFQSELDNLLQRVCETDSHVKADSVSAKNKIQQGIAELAHELEDTTRQSGELQKVIKRQAKHLAELQSLYDEVQRHLVDASSEISTNESRCLNLQRELDNVRHSIEQGSSPRVHVW